MQSQLYISTFGARLADYSYTYMVASEARNTATNTVPAAMSLERVAPAACSSSGSFDPLPAGAAAAVAEASSVGVGGAPDVSGSAAAGVPDDGSVAGVVAAGVVADGGEVPATGGVEPSPVAASAASQEKWQLVKLVSGE